MAEEMNKARQKVKGKKWDSPIQTRWAIFLFFPFILVEAHAEQKAAIAEGSNQFDCVVFRFSVLRVQSSQKEEKQWDSDAQVLRGRSVF